jgi:glucose-1-phosphate adenylyltransferase
MVGVVVRGGTSQPLAPLGVPADMALAPFAARYRLSDFARATLRNSRVRLGTPDAEVPVDRAADPAAAASPTPRPGARLLAGLRTAARLPQSDPDAPVVILVADHILDADLRPVLDHHHRAGADLGLLCIVSGGGTPDASLLARGGRARLAGASDDTVDALALAWTGDLVVRAGSLPRLLATLEYGAPGDDADHIRVLAQTHHLVLHDLLAARPSERRPYWHEPSSVEAYYGAHMDLCTDSPRLDLYDPGWPVVGTGDGLPPAKVVSGEASHAGQALNALLGDGAVIRGGSVIRSVVGRGALVEVGAEIEDSLLLDGCRVGRDARVRRAVIGAGAVVGDGEHIGYDDDPCASAVTQRRPSGLTLVLPAGAEAQPVAAHGRD